MWRHLAILAALILVGGCTPGPRLRPLRSDLAWPEPSPTQRTSDQLERQATQRLRLNQPQELPGH